MEIDVSSAPDFAYSMVLYKSQPLERKSVKSQIQHY